jgi:hypothetical protein
VIGVECLLNNRADDARSELKSLDEIEWPLMREGSYDMDGNECPVKKFLANIY